MFKKGKMILSYLLAFILAFSIQLPVMAANNSDCLTITGSSSYTTVVGAELPIRLDQLFTDSGHHQLSYQLVSPQATNWIKFGNKAENGGTYLSFTENTAGDYQVVVKASCSKGISTNATLNIHVEPAPDGIDAQYGYDQSDASEVTVYVTVSSDGIPILGNDEDATPLSHLKVTVPYFDLDRYGLEDYYRYETDESASYNGDRVIQRPTALHLYIYLLERYYFGLSEEECLSGDQDLSETSDFDIMNMFGEEAYSNSLSGLYLTGSATSMYMQNFWGHDENLMYYRNHCYPLQRAGWGSTADYILLSDNDTIDLAMFTDWGFYTHGAFMCFGNTQSSKPVNDFNLTAGETLNLQCLKFGTQSVAEGGVDNFVPMTTDHSVYVVPEDEMTLDDLNLDMAEPVESSDPDVNGSLWSYTFEKPGTYYVMALDDNAGTEDACNAPATAKVVVKAAQQTLKITQQPSDYSGKLNSNAVFQVAASGTGLKYQWYYSKDGTSFVKCSAADAKTDTMTVALVSYRNGYRYYCKVTDSAGNSVDSKVVTLSLAATPLSITKQPVDAEANIGDTVKFSVTASGTGLKYQWYYSSNSGTSWNASGMTGSKTNTLEVPLTKARVGQMYRCTVTDENKNSITSKAVTLKMKSVPVVITQNPVDYQAVVNETASFTVKGTGENVSYQWYYSNDNGAKWAKSTLTGCTSSILQVPVKAYRFGQMFRCVLTDGNGNTATSEAASLLEKKASIAITSQPKSITGAVIGQTYQFSVTATGNNLKYQWYYSKDQGKNWYKSGATGATTNTMSISMVASRSGQMYRCQITDATGAIVTSEGASIQ